MGYTNYSKIPKGVQKDFADLGIKEENIPGIENITVQTKGLFRDRVYFITLISENYKNGVQRASVIKNKTYLEALKNIFLKKENHIHGKITNTRISMSNDEVNEFITKYPNYTKYQEDERFYFAKGIENGIEYVSIFRNINKFEIFWGDKVQIPIFG